MAPDDCRAEAAAFYQFVVAGAAILGPLAGGYLADAAGYQAGFLLSAAWRWLGIFVFLWLAARPAARARKQAATESLSTCCASDGWRHSILDSMAPVVSPGRIARLGRQPGCGRHAPDVG